jgi:predicted small lipoprotein YifL
MKRQLCGACALTLTLGLAACGEPGPSRGKDAAAYTGPSQGAIAYAAGGWTPGDKTSWEQGLKARGQYGQNDHAR